MKSLKRKKIAIVILSLLCSFGCLSVGFASWAITGGDYANISGIIDSEAYEYTDHPISTITFTSTPSFTALEGRGFLNSSNEYVNSVTLTWDATFNSQRASDFIDSLSSNKIWLQASISFSNTASIVSNFTISSMTISLDSATTIQKNEADTVKDSTHIYQEWNIESIALSSSVSFTITIPLVFTGSLSSFPNLSTNKVTLTMTPGEYVDE